MKPLMWIMTYFMFTMSLVLTLTLSSYLLLPKVKLYKPKPPKDNKTTLIIVPPYNKTLKTQKY